MDQQQPDRIVNAVAPIRICDNGGWTDTWFAQHGRVLNVAVYPYAEVQIEVYPRASQSDRVIIHAENYGERYAPRTKQPEWDRHPLLEAAIAMMKVPEDLAVQVTIFSEAPAGASTGTSAAVTVALIGALDRLTPGRLSPHETACAAQRVETDMLGQQCGIQDQICSAFGGINDIEMTAYPHCTVSPVSLPDSTWWELERRLVLVYLGRSHSSSDVHRQVIAELEHEGPDCPRLQALRGTAVQARNALYAGDFTAFGQSMIRNTEAQGHLHSSLISADAVRIMDLARQFGALGWKVNGAGGEGGSLTLLTGGLSHEKRALIQAIEAEKEGFRTLPIMLSRRGLRTWECEPAARGVN